MVNYNYCHFANAKVRKNFDIRKRNLHFLGIFFYFAILFLQKAHFPYSSTPLLPYSSHIHKLIIRVQIGI